VVRTNFIVNSIVVGLLLLVICAFLQREYRAYALRGSINSMEQRIQASEADDNLNLKQSERFRESAQYVKEVQRFFRAPFAAHELLAELALLKPEGLIFTRVTYAETSSSTKAKKGKRGKAAASAAKMSYSINVGGDVRGLPVLAQFKSALQASSLLKPEGFEAVVMERMQQRNAKTGITPFEISISLKPELSSVPSKGGKK
jgi:hypothetical protein